MYLPSGGEPAAASPASRSGAGEGRDFNLVNLARAFLAMMVSMLSQNN